MKNEGIVHTIEVACSACGEPKVFSARTKTGHKTKALRKAAVNSKCWYCGKK